MKFSELWLRKFLHLNIKTKDIKKQLTLIGIEVDNVTQHYIDLRNIIVGKIMFCYANNVNFINVVDIGNNEYLLIKSSIKLFKNIKVIVKKIKYINSIYYKKNIFKNFFYKSMICLYKDLFVSNNNNLITLYKDSKIGYNINKYIINKDNLFNVNIPSNRMNSIGIITLAQELYAFNKVNYKIPLQINNINPTISKTLKLLICSNKNIKYLGRIITNVNLHTHTPLWIQEKLFHCDISSKDIITDIINYIFIETGQLLHIFNYEAINNNIYVRLSKYKEHFFSLNNKIYTLDKPYWVIADDKKIFSLGANGLSKFARVNNDVNAIFIGSVNIKTIINYKLKNFDNILKYSNMYFGKTIDCNLQEYIVNYATKLILKICGGNVSNLICSDFLKKKNIIKKIKLNIKNIYSVIGFYISEQKIFNILRYLNYKIFIYNKNIYVSPPSSRLDVKIKEDVINDIIRIYGCNNILSKPFTSICQVYRKNNFKNVIAEMKSILVNKGYHEIVNYSFVDPKMQNILFPKKKTIVLKNPISRDLSILRTSLLNGLIKTLLYNKNRQQENIRLFESGLCFFPDKNEYLGMKQQFFFSGIIYGTQNPRHWGYVNKKLDFYDLKGDLENIFTVLNKYFFVNFQPLNEKFLFLHPVKSSSIIIQNSYKGFMGTLHPKLQDVFNLDNTVNFFEFSLDMKMNHKKKIFFSSFSMFPSSKRDIVVIISEKILSIDVIKICKNISKENIIDVCCFDVYKGSNVIKGCKSIAIGLVFQNKKYTLQEYEINFFVEKCIFALQKILMRD
ncbi:phenylalanine--tRNA ligase subunit beta [Buchnera aphidicola (Mollitrichosiphum nigrofasciatum)]|uniref:phenylalanine--tRNA ligase subunit beta n=1 Tax=Buchnera aphidicola TaxID=9 RepID=UPI0031B870CF